MSTSVSETAADKVRARLTQRASRPTWEQVCEVLDRSPPSQLADAISAIDEGLATWPADVNKINMWPLPPRQAYDVWVQKYVLQGKPVPKAWSVFTFLQLHDHKFGKQGSAPLFAHPGLATITHLYLAQCGLGPVGLAELLASPHTGAVTHLVIRGNKLGAGSGAKLLPHALGQQLQLLDIGANQLSMIDIEALLSTPMPRLKTLCFDYADIPVEQLARVLHADTLPAIEALALRGRQGDGDLELARAQGHPHIKRALWRAHLLSSDTKKLKALAATRGVAKASKLNRVGLIDALYELAP